MPNRGTRGAYRKEDRVALPPELQRELVEKAAARTGNCQELAKRLTIPKSSVHYYLVGRLTMPASVLEEMLRIAQDSVLEERIRNRAIEKDRTWAKEYAVSVYREMCRERVTLPTREELERNAELRRKAAAIMSYVLAEGSVWLQKEKWGECAVNITFASHETDLYAHFRSLCLEVFRYDIGPPQKPGNGALAIRGFIYSRFIAEWLIQNGVHPGEKSSRVLRLPAWVMKTDDPETWIAALQPWFDGEGSVSATRTARRRQFVISQSKHTDLDFDIPRWRPGESRNIGVNELKRMTTCDFNSYDFCRGLFRSELLADVRRLLTRIGLSPEFGIAHLYLKDDGFCSCIWTIRLNGWDTQKALSLGLITQARKRRSLQVACTELN